MTLLCQAEFILAAAILLYGIWGRMHLRPLRRLVTKPMRHWPKVSIIVAARNEAAGIEKALGSLLSLDYPSLEWIVVDDRSEDDTPKVLKQMKDRELRLKVIRIEKLPPGWLGKNHALYAGARKSSGQYLLFTDADVVYKDPSILKRILPTMIDDGIDHATALPHLFSRSWLADGFIAFFGMQFMIYFSPWRAPKRGTKDFVGVGAFNLVKATALAAAGGFERIRLRPDDDVKLGKILKLSGFRTELFPAAEELECEWHPTLRACLRGLEKSVFPGFDYRVSQVFVGIVGSTFVHGLPFALPFLCGPQALPWAIGAAALQVVTVSWVSWMGGNSPLYGLLTPFSQLFLLWALVRNTVVILRRGGMEWRGTVYSLAELRQNPV